MTIDSSKPKVLVVASLGPAPYVGGIENVVDTLLNSDLTHSFDFSVFDTYRVPNPQRTQLERACYLARLPFTCWSRLQEAKPDIVHIHFCSGVDFWRHSVCLAVCRCYGAKTVFHLHGGKFIAFFEEMTPIRQALTKCVFGFADRVIALSTYWKDFLSAVAPSGRIRVLSNPIDCERLSAGLRQPDMNAPTVLLLGRLGMEKGHYDVIKAMPLVLKKHPTVRVLFAGGDDEPGATEHLKDAARKADVDRNIDFLGPVPFDPKVQLLQSSTIMILPSHYENMPLSILEGMAAGMPVISTRVGAIPEVLDDGKAGLLIDPGDWKALAQGINQLLDDPMFAVNLGAVASERAKQLWDVDQTAKRLKAFYEELLAP